MEVIASNHDWAWEQLCEADFGNRRRSMRATLMLRRALQQPAGRLTEVFSDPAELQGAYDFVQGSVAPERLCDALSGASVRAVRDEKEAYVVIDGTSLSLTDRTGRKEFGVVGARRFPTHGLKVVDALVLTERGVPAGICHLEWWARGPGSSRSRAERRRLRLTETEHWIRAIDAVRERFRTNASDTKPCYVIDREGDCASILDALAKSGGRFIVRAAQNRPLLVAGRRRKLRTTMQRQRVIATRVVDIPAAPGRRARRSVFEIRSKRVLLDLPDRPTGRRFQIAVGVVSAVERCAPRGEKRLDWMLLTSDDVCGPDAAARVLDGYCMRWRIEDFHKAWKSGRCRVEDTQLRKRDHVIRWATLLAAVATRAEQLKHLARTKPDAPASIALTTVEIEGLVAIRNRRPRRNEPVVDTNPSIATAVRWIAELGGYTGKSSGGPPGTITIGRGLERLVIWAEAYWAGRTAK